MNKFWRAGVPAVIFAAIAVAAIIGGGLTFGVIFAVGAGIVGLAALGALIVGIVEVADYVSHKKAYERASTPEQMAAIYWSLQPEARMRCLVALGPDFRAALLAMEKQSRHIPPHVSLLCEFLESIDNPTVPEPLKKQYFMDESPELWAHIPEFHVLLPLLQEAGVVKADWVAALS